MDLVTWDFIVECDLECLHATGYLSKMSQHHHHGVSYRYSAESISRIDRAVHMRFSTFFFGNIVVYISIHIILLQHNVLPQVLRHSTQQALALQPLAAEQAVRIPIRAIAQNRDNRVARAKLHGQIPRRSNV